MANTRLRVAVWSTGGIGSIAIRTIQQRSELELVGVWVHSADKAGRDVGEILGMEPIGIIATDDADALIELRPDCIVYAANPPERDAASVPDYAKFLAAGINLVSTSATPATYPPAYLPEWVSILTAAAQAGQASFYASGIEPGFAADHLPLLLATQSSSITKVHAYEIGLYDDYPTASVLMDAMGFGRPLDFEPAIAQPGAILWSWGGSVRMIADALGVKLDGMRETFERLPTPRTLEVACGTLEAGTCGALRLQAIGVVGDRDAIIIEHVTRMASDLAPEWPTSKRDVGYIIEIEGVPNIHCEYGLSLADPAAAGVPGMDAGAGAMVATAMRVVNAIPYVVAARPGLLSSLDLPLTIPRGAFAKGGQA